MLKRIFILLIPICVIDVGTFPRCSIKRIALLIAHECFLMGNCNRFTGMQMFSARVSLVIEMMATLLKTSYVK